MLAANRVTQRNCAGVAYKNAATHGKKNKNNAELKSIGAKIP
jgi:hypothetical protein